MDIPSYFYVITNSLLVLIGAVLLWRRGRPGFALWLVIAWVSSTAGMEYIVQSQEIPGHTEPLSLTYRAMDALTNFGYLAYTIAVVALCSIAAPQKT